ncbi:tetratricopeptide repeat protein [Campylobacter sp. JMF_08 NE1]|uniref:tetratricopeptide repeat protein n=1 Tax=Campylobacter sp. JMF_08 NE1 TaxID=2983821 RepID=UPI0022E9FC79|nr:tetratricopeptide repeat protein [Campylobacter sp. JMF_08 NE1]MDA3047489.1 sel1 repeat family protein [Campylobacter sp. JMF_08 NE1]
MENNEKIQEIVIWSFLVVVILIVLLSVVNREKENKNDTLSTYIDLSELNEKCRNYDHVSCVKLFEESKKLCDKNDNEGCENLAFLYLNGYSVERNNQKAKELYKRVCDNGIASSCEKLGVVYEIVEKDEFSASYYYRVACSNNIYTSCSRLGFYYLRGKGVEQDLSKAKEFAEKGCNGEDGVGCWVLGIYYQSIDKSKSKEYYGKACDYRFESGCENYKIFNEEGY